MKLIARSSCDDKMFFDSEFAKLPERVRKDPYRVGLLPEAVWRGFLQMTEGKPAEFWILQINGQTVGRVGANRSFVDSSRGAVGFFEVDLAISNPQAVAQELLSAAENYVCKLGAKKIFGPLNLNTWFSYRLSIESQNREKFVWEPVTPENYISFFQSAGYSVVETYSSEAFDLEKLMNYTKKSYEQAIENGYSFREFDGNLLLEKEVPILYKISMEGFQKNYLFEPIPYELFQQLYVPIAKKMDFQFSHYVLDKNKNELGFGFAFLDKDYLILKTYAMLNSARGLGLSNAFTYLSCKKAFDINIKKAVAALVKSGAQSSSYATHSTQFWKHEYVLYEKDFK